MPRTAGLVALKRVATVQTHSVAKCVWSLHEGAPTLLAVVPHLDACRVPLGLRIASKGNPSPAVCCTDAAVTQKDLLRRDGAQSIAVREQMDFVSPGAFVDDRCPQKGVPVLCACGALSAPLLCLLIWHLAPWRAALGGGGVAAGSSAASSSSGSGSSAVFSCRARRLGSKAATGTPGSSEVEHHLSKVVPWRLGGPDLKRHDCGHERCARDPCWWPHLRGACLDRLDCPFARQGFGGAFDGVEVNHPCGGQGLPHLQSWPGSRYPSPSEAQGALP